ncbi:MAG: AIM24 family protein [Lachnospiraceae bacterium]|nr:AIM24 family protein [Lachnospiraceae bacterium]
MITLNNLAENQNMKVIAEKGIYTVFEHQKDMSVSPEYASVAYFMHEMNVRKRQVLCRMNNSAVKLQAGAMQWTAGQVDSSTGVKGVGDFLGKALKGAVTSESAVKPLYQGSGFLMLEPTYRYIILEDVSRWGSGIVLDDGLFLACDACLQEKIIARSNASSALLGGEGLFNLSLSGSGIAVLESPVPREELIEIVVQDDVVKIDGNMAIAWSNTLQFTVEKSSKSLMGSALNGEGFVNVYRGSGKILLAPTVNGTTMSPANGPKTSNTTSSKGLVSSVVKSALDL